ncbi:hypothetical protein D3C85_934560 [compost metagenome]
MVCWTLVFATASTNSAFLPLRSPEYLVASTAGLMTLSKPVRLPSSTLSIAPATAPHAVCPMTSTTLAPAAAQANSMLPSRSLFEMLPATRPLNVSPMPASRMISAGARESMQLRITAAGNCPEALERFCAR